MLTPALAALHEAAATPAPTARAAFAQAIARSSWPHTTSQTARKRGSPRENPFLTTHAQNNTPERKTSVSPWKRVFSPVASALPEEKQFSSGD
jgi:hypothetical protein